MPPISRPSSAPPRRSSTTPAVGRDRAGIGGLDYLQEFGIAAATVGHDTARIGDGADMMASGVITHANAARRLARGRPRPVLPRRRGRAAAGASRRIARRREALEAAFLLIAEAPQVWALNSASLVLPEHKDAIVVTGSHGGLLGGRPETALKYDVLGALYNDAGIGKDEAGISRLPALDARGIAAATVSAASARIGDARSTYEDGIISRVNSARAAALGLREGISARELRRRAAPRRSPRIKEEAMSHTLQNRPSGTMTGGRALAEMLRLAGAGPMFGMGGFQLLPFYDAVGLVGLNHHLINDERCGAFAADAYARVTNRPGICDGTLGPGATNLVTGLIESLNGGIPIVAIAGDTNRAHSWKNMTQECRQVEILRPAVKELIRVEMTSRIPELVRRAFAVATSGRPGPVLLDVPEDVAHGAHDFAPEDFVIDEATLKAPARRIRPDRADIERAAKLIAKAKRPLLLTGGGIHLSEAWNALTRFAEAQSIPVAHTMSGKGGIACTNPLNRRPVRPLFAHRQRSDRGVGLPDRRRLQARRDRDQALRAAAGAHPGHPSRHRRRGDRPLHPGRDRAVGRRARRARRPCRRAVGQRRGRPCGARRLRRRDRAAHAGLGRRRRAAAQFARPAGAHGAPLPRAEQDPAGRRDPRRRWRVRRALDRAALRHQEGRTALHPGSRLCLDRLRAAGRDGGVRLPRPTGRSSRSAATAAST